MYWVVLALAITTESYLNFILSRLPLYSFFRFGFLLWLVLPQTQGASQLYLGKVRPFLLGHDQEIDKIVASAIVRAKSLGSEYVSQAITFIQNIIYSAIGLDRKDSSGHQSQHNSALMGDNNSDVPQSAVIGSLTEGIFSRFKLPNSENLSFGSIKLPASSSVGMGLLQSYLSAAGPSKSRSIDVPTSLTKAEKLNFLEEHQNELSKILESVTEQKKSVEMESEDETKDDGFDFVKQEDFRPTVTQTDHTAGESEDKEVDTAESTALDQPETKSWFRFR